MKVELTSKDAQVLQNSINRSIHNLKLKKHDLGVEVSCGLISHAKRSSGAAKLNAKIDHLRWLSGHLEDAKLSGDISLGDFLASGPVIEVTRTVVTTETEETVQTLDELEIVVWEGEGGLCRD